MKRLLSLSLFLFLSVIGCRPKEEASLNPQQIQERRLQLFADGIIDDLQYLKDPRTSQCFAYCWGGAANGGPALATVNCESIPKELLIVATQK